MKKPTPAVNYHRMVIERDGPPPDAETVATVLTQLFSQVGRQDCRFVDLEVTTRDGAARRIDSATDLADEIHIEALRPRPPVPDLPIWVQVATRPPPEHGAVLNLRLRNHPKAQLAGLEVELRLAEMDRALDEQTLLTLFREFSGQFLMTRGWVETPHLKAQQRGPYSRRLLGWLTLTSPLEKLTNASNASSVLHLNHGAQMVVLTAHLPTADGDGAAALSKLVATIGPSLNEPPEPAKSPAKTPERENAPPPPKAEPEPEVSPRIVPPKPAKPPAASSPLSGTVDLNGALAKANAVAPLPFAEKQTTTAPNRRDGGAPRPPSFTGTLDVATAIAIARSNSPTPFGEHGGPASNPPEPRQARLPDSQTLNPSEAPAASASQPPAKPNAAADLSLPASEAKNLTAPLNQPPAGLSLEQYASLRAEMALYPDHAREIAKRYRVADEAAWHALHEAWQAWLARDHAQWQRFRELEKRYVAWFSKHGKPP